MEPQNQPHSDVFEGLRRGDSAMQAMVWNDHYPSLVRAARRKLAGFPCRVFDEEDVAAAALHSFFDAVRDGAIYPWNSVGELFRLLTTITRRKAFAFRRRETRAKRGGGLVRGHSALCAQSAGDSQPTGTGKEPQDEGPSPRTAFIRTEDEQQILDALPDEVLRQIATLRSQGHTNDEIAMILGCARRTVERKVERIRRVLSKTA